MSESERVHGARSVASAVLSPSGGLLGALHVVGSTSVFTTDRVPGISGAVRQASAELGRAARG